MMRLQMVHGILVLGATLTLGLAGCGTPQQQQESAENMSTEAAQAAAVEFNDQGELVLPAGYRTWVYVGSVVTPASMNGGNPTFNEVQVAYIDPVAYQEYHQTGQFPDGTAFAKDLMTIGDTVGEAGKGYYEGHYAGLAFSVKDANRFPDEPGHWAYFFFPVQDGAPTTMAQAAKPTSDCNACHQAHAADDWVYTQYWPVLKAAKPAG